MRGPPGTTPSIVSILHTELRATEPVPQRPGHILAETSRPAPLPSHPGLYLNAYELAQVVGVHEYQVRALTPHVLLGQRGQGGDWEYGWDVVAPVLRERPWIYGRA
jgi:hypothetical protein